MAVEALRRKPLPASAVPLRGRAIARPFFPQFLP
jgi:hypothetical protein